MGADDLDLRAGKFPFQCGGGAPGEAVVAAHWISVGDDQDARHGWSLSREPSRHFRAGLHVSSLRGWFCSFCLVPDTFDSSPAFRTPGATQKVHIRVSEGRLKSIAGVSIVP